ncbi:MAG: HAD-IIIA family hydrolase [Fibrobacteres bacterium]|nr:HAD-IIIA family hydrolase [Fibrobacterota bacterium]
MIGVILAGGKGTRLGHLAEGIPKPMVNCAGKPVLMYHLELLKRYGIRRVILLLGYKSEVIKKYLGDGSGVGLDIEYVEEQEPLGTAGAVANAASLINEPFVLIYGDVLADLDLERLVNFHNKSGSLVTLALHPNSHPVDSDLIEIDSQSRVVACHSKPHEGGRDYQNLVNAGVYVMSDKIIPFIPKGFNDFGKNIFPLFLKNDINMSGYLTTEYIKDMGTPDRLASVEKDVLSGKVASRNLTVLQKAIFIDRDGVINKEVGVTKSAQQLELLPRVEEAIKKINQSKYLAIVVTNQPGVAKGFCSMAEIQNMHNRLDTLLGKTGAFVDAYYFCPHHPEKGFPGENPDFKIDCDCRKPKIGLIKQAVGKYNIDLSASFIIGDSTVDLQTGLNAGLRSVLVKTGHAGGDNRFNAVPNYVSADLYDAVNFILNGLDK